MRLARVFRQRLRSLFHASRVEDDLQQELAIHLDQLIKENRAAGMSESEARDAARRAFGGIAIAAEQCRETRRLGLIEDLGKDLAFASRLLAKSPAFTATAVLSLALGIGAIAATFGVIDALMLRMLPVRSPEQLVVFYESTPDARTPRDLITTYEQVLKYRRMTDVFDDVAAVALMPRSNVAIGNDVDPGQARVALVSGNYFSMLSIRARIGRILTPEDDRIPGGHPVAVISDAYWTRRFARSAGVLGAKLTLYGTAYTIIGVTPPEWKGEWVGRPVDFWVSTMMESQVAPEFPQSIARNVSWVRVLARLKPGVSLRQAESAGQALYLDFFREWTNPTPQQRQYLSQAHLVLRPAGNGFSPQRDHLTSALTILMIVSGLVLLIACANVANLLLVRSAARRRETAVRLAIGASGGRIMRQLLAESVLLSSLAGVLGFLFALWGSTALTAALGTGPVQSDSRLPSAGLALDLTPDWRVFGFAAALCFLTGILFGLAPAIRSVAQGSASSLAQALRERRATFGLGGRFGPGKLLVIAQVAISMLLLIGAGLLVRTLYNLRTQSLGVDRRNVLLVWTVPGQTGRQADALASFVQTVQERLSAIPGVVHASMSNHGPLEGGEDLGGLSEFVKIPGKASKPGLPLMRVAVAPHFFEALGMPVLEGRGITDHDTDRSPQVIVLNETAARFFFGSESPIGKHLAIASAQVGFPYEIVGVVADGKHGSARDKRGIEYVPYRQIPGLMRNMCIEIRTAGSPESIAARVRQELRAIDPNLPVLGVDTIEQQLDDVLAQERLIATLCAGFGAVAMLLACLGLYGVMSYLVVCRTNEIGVRMALGASHSDVLRMVLGESLTMVAGGIAIGVPAALMATRLIANRLFGVGAGDPATIGAAVALMAAVAVLSGWLPASRASRVDPLCALRHE